MKIEKLVSSLTTDRKSFKVKRSSVERKLRYKLNESKLKLLKELLISENYVIIISDTKLYLIPFEKLEKLKLKVLP